MKRRNQGNQPKTVFTRNLLSVLIGSIFAASSSYAVPLVVKDPAGNGVAGYRWLLQEDTTKESVPGDPAVPGTHLSLSFHTSYAPVVRKGHTATADADIGALDPAKRYFVSVLPDSAGIDGGYSNGGTQVNPAGTTTVTVNQLPFPTAQISVFIFEDNHRVNNAPDLPEETGLAGFNLQLFEAGGSYGANGGRLLYDAFGNLLGTTYKPDGSVLTPGTGIITTDANGIALIKNLAPGKYTIFVTPRNNNTEQWVQTATIEGTLGVDAWVKANEPAYFQEFGQPGHHVFIGFVKPTNTVSAATGGRTITGRIVNQHMSRPPDYAFYDGEPVDRCWVGLNDAGGNMVYAQKCNADSTFAIPNVPPGDYELAIWDEPLDVLFASHFVHVPDPGEAPVGDEVALNDVPVFNWFGRVKGQVFYDTDEDGFPDPGEVGIPNQAVNLRFRDGSIYQLNSTDSEGTYEFHETFPFFNWLIAEVDFARYKATGVTVTVDGGGPIDPSDPWSFDGTLNPQDQQECTGYEQLVNGCTPGPFVPYRTETGPVLLQGVQTFLGQSNAMEWGKKNYNVAAGENGGISGIVRYATTRAEDDPRYAAAENWEPGIPGVTVNLYQDADNNGVPDGAAIASVTTDSWDASLPTGCRGDVFVHNGQPTDCYDGLRNFNQVRPAVFDGGYAFMDVPDLTTADPNDTIPLPPGTYIVEAIAPPGYEHVKEEDKNVDFGDSYVPAPAALPPVCVGAAHTVPPELVLFQGVPSVYANQSRPLCDRKQVRVAAGQNPPADFFMYTEVPVAGQIVGMILNDLANEFDPNAPNFGEKYAPPHMPISIQDWTGREISRVYSDEYGTYNALVPSTYTINAPMPSGVSPNMLTACLNSPIKPDGTSDPWFNPQYTQFCYTFQYMPGKTTYLDTPVLPIAAMTGPGRFPLDCEYGEATPMVRSVTNNDGQGPWTRTRVGTGAATSDQTLTITAMGAVQVPNPAWGAPGEPKTISRNYGFGADTGTRSAKIVSGSNSWPLEIATWSDSEIVAAIPRGARSGQLVITRGDNGQSTVDAITITVSTTPPLEVGPTKPYQTIQAAIDDAPAGALITVGPGNYSELPIMYKPIQLQGWGPGVTFINAVKSPAEKIQGWRAKINDLLAANQFSLLPGQAAPIPPIDPANNEPGLFGSDEGAGVTVVAPSGGVNRFSLFTGVGSRARPRIDGFSITGSDIGGGIFVNGFANNLEISNNRIYANQGTYGGGIHLGNPLLVNGDEYTDGSNDNVYIHNNKISQNGSLDGAGGGISLYAGSDNYQVSANYVCGNFATGGGGGIAHLGLSNGGNISRNTVLFNESFNQGLTVHGGGLLIAGQAGLGAGQMSPGSGNVTVEANLIQGNLAGAGDGGGIRTEFVNGDDAADGNPNHRVDLFDNMIVNNIAGLAGGGISMQDTARIRIIHNTIANNDSTATAGQAFAPGSPNVSTAQPAGVVAHAHSPDLAAPAALNCPANVPDSMAWKCFSSPTVFANNVVWHNRSFYWWITNFGAATPASFGLVPDIGAGQAPVYADLGVVGGPASYCLKPNNSVLSLGTDTCGGAFNTTTDNPLFMADYVNNAPGQTVQQPELTTAIATAPALDEGGNYIDIAFGPLSLNLPINGDGALPNYHLGNPSAAVDRGTPTALSQSTLLATDIDGQARPIGAPDAGADEAR